MKLSYNWLQELCAFGLSHEEAASRLTMAGLEVEEIEPAGRDWLLTAEVTSNRPDLLCHIGVARELSALTGIPLQRPPVDFAEGGEPVERLVDVRVDDFELCPRYTARVIRGIKIGPSPAWLQARLEGIGLRPVNNVVDVTNYVLMECGQPLHAFDMKKLRGPKIIVRRAQAGERIVAIDGTAHELTGEMLVIADAERPVAVAGVMGGLETEVGERTVDVLLESALFHPANIRRTSRRLKLESDSSYRFERGVDPDLADWASRRAAKLIQQVAGGTIAKGVADARKAPYTPKTVAMRIERFRRLIGAAVGADEAAQILSRLGFEIREKDRNRITVSVPSFRANDVYREADLIEEVARIHGYDKIPVATAMRIALGKLGKQELLEDRVRGAMVAMGYSESVTFALTDPQREAAVSPWTPSPAIAVANPMVRDYSVMRRSLLPGLLLVKQTNERHGVRACHLFELSQVYLAQYLSPGMTSGALALKPHLDALTLPEERTCLSFVSDGDFRAAKGVVEEILRQCGILERCRFALADLAFFDPGERVAITLNGKLIGCLGRISKKTAADFELRSPCCAAEIDFSALVQHAVLDRKHVRLPSYPAVERDLAVIVDESVTWEALCQVIEGLGIDLLRSVEFFDLYRGKPVPEGRKSLAFSLLFRSDDRTLTGEEVNKAVERLVSALRERFSAELRSA